MKLPLLSAALLLAATGSSLGQTTGTQFGLQAGVTQSVLDGTINNNAQFKTGYVLGGFVRFRPSARVAFQPELNLARQGSRNEQQVGYGTILRNSTHLTYLNVPLLLKVYLGNVVNLQAGPQLGLLVSGREKGQVGYISSSNGSGYVEGDEDVKADYKSDVAVCFGLGADLKNGLSVAARLNYGVTDIENNDFRKAFREAYDFGGLHNRTLQFTVGYAFGSK
ncbi:porin family protein [Hymenobacter canadensis]|uniref:Porin family protein n=1 Tax=Hymenobacter canadensis TaxID=2999067 RepID=A0ABY7LNF5_9BACT|nr:porin family protein [Hymenobacter canadensis]WBA41369.1 porin family protein [Hymenobacter canadensis]